MLEYCGEILSQETSLERMATIYKDMPHYYFLDYDNGEVVDGCQKGSIARFINHSCDPNCRIEKWTVGSEFRIGVFAEKDIAPGEEITYNYRFESFGFAQTCRCGAANCRGMYSCFIDVSGVIGVSKKNDEDKPVVRKAEVFKSLVSPSGNKKRLLNVDDRGFWVKKHAREHWESQYKEVMKNRLYYYYMRLFLVRNVKSMYEHKKARESRQSFGSQSMSRRAMMEVEPVSQAILKRRKRSLEEIMESLGECRK